MSAGAIELAGEQVIGACRRLAEAGLVPGSSGNVSLRAGELVAITGSGVRLGEAEPAALAVVELDGAQRSGPPPSSELALHLGVHRRYGAGAVVHTHPPVASALACVLDEVPVVHYGMMALGGGVRVAPYARFGSAELAELTVEALADRTAALMANHGALTYGADLNEAVERALLLEWACTVFWQAAAIGTPRALSATEQAEVLAAMGDR